MKKSLAELFESREHGTLDGYQEHQRLGEEVCAECRRARSAYASHRRFRAGKIHVPRKCRACGSVFPGHHCGGVR